MRFFYVAAILSVIAVGALIACGEEQFYPSSGYSPRGDDAYGAEAMSEGDSSGDFVVQKVEVESQVQASDGTPFQIVEVSEEATSDTETQTISTSGDEDFASSPNPPATNRVIVRNADVEIESEDLAGAMRSIGDIALSLGGWVVESEISTGTAIATMTVRVPAAVFEDALAAIESVGTNWISSKIDSTDFTEEYTDLGSRIAVLEQTIESLTALLEAREQDSEVEDILEVQREIAAQQTLLETARGRIRFISESAAFSKIEVLVQKLPEPMRIEVEPSFGVPLNESYSFSVKFWPPEGHDQYQIVWDFGSGSDLFVTDRAIRSVEDDGSFTSAPVTTVFSSRDYSEYVGKVTATASSDVGVSRGESSFRIEVFERPTLNPLLRVVNPQPITPGEEVEFNASFNDHSEVRDLRYELRFGDGTEPQTGEIAQGVNTLTATHTYARYVPWQFSVQLTLTGDSDAGPVSESTAVSPFMREAPSIQPSVFAPGEVAANAVNVLVVGFGWAGNAVVFLAITSPVWLLFIGAIVLIVWVSGRKRTKRPAAAPGGDYRPPGEPDATDANGDGSESGDETGEGEDEARG